MRKIIVTILFTFFYLIRHRAVADSDYTAFVVDMQAVEPIVYIPGNVWRWAE